MSGEENKKTFEKNLAELESVVKALEASDVSLEEMIALFEKGVKLSKDCSEYLESAKQKIITLTEKESEDNG